MKPAVGALIIVLALAWPSAGSLTIPAPTPEPPDFRGPAEDVDIHVRPGAPLRLGGTLGLLFDDALTGARYASTAGHAVDHVGQEIRLRDPWDYFVGHVVALYNNPFETPEDWALIQIDPDVPASPSVRHWTGPSGMPLPGAINEDDVVCHYGYGTPFDLLEETRHRCGTLAYFRTQNGLDTYRFRGTAWGGDSGSPVIHYETGQAIGLLVKGEIALYLFGGLDVCTMLDRFAIHGFDLELATAPYDPPPADLTVPIPASIEPFGILYGNNTSCFGP